MTILKRGAAIIGVGLIGWALAAPEAWFESAPTALLPGGVPPGLMLWRAALILLGLVLIGGAVGFRHRHIGQADRLIRAESVRMGRDVSPSAAFWGMIAITLIGAALRLHEFNSELWIDEIAHRIIFRDATYWQIFATYTSANNHLLNSLLCKLLVDLLGEGEVAVRLPAVMFGIVTIPAAYWFFRVWMLRWEALGGALLLAFSYHHIFFTQNSRGYSALIFCGLMATGALIHALRTDRLRGWALYVAAAILGMASNLLFAFVMAAHGLIVLVLWLRTSFGRTLLKLPMLRRLITVYGLLGVLTLVLYAPILPLMVGYYGEYDTIRGAFNPFSLRFVEEVLHGLSPQFVTNLAVVGGIGGVVGLIGFIGLARRAPVITAALLLPHVLLLAFSAVVSVPIYPRLFIFALIFIFAVGMQLASMTLGLIPRVREAAGLKLAAVAAAALISALLLVRYYAIPKQPFRTALEYVEAMREADDRVIMVDIASAGYEYYGSLLGLSDETYFTARSPERFEELIEAADGRRVILITTLDGVMPEEYRALMGSGWQRERTFPALVGDAQVSVWVPR